MSAWTQRACWLPAVAALVVAAVTLGMWKSLQPIEQERVQLESAKVVGLLGSHLAGRLRGELGALLRATESLDGSADLQRDFDLITRQHLRDFPALIALRYQPPDGPPVVGWRATFVGHALFDAMPALGAATPTQVGAYAQWLSPPVAMSADRHVYFLVISPVAAGSAPRLVAALDAGRWLGDDFADERESLRLLDGSTLIVESGRDDTDPRGASQSTFSELGHDWTLVATPTAAAVRQASSALPGMVLFGGLLLAALAALATHLAMIAGERRMMVADTRADRDQQSAVRAAAEADRDRAYDQLDAVLGNISDGFLIVDSNWCYTYVNQIAAAHTGIDAATLLGRNLWAVLPTIAVTEEAEWLRAAMRDRSSISYEGKGVDGRWYWVRGYPYLDGLAIYFHDIQVEREFADRLRESEVMLNRAQAITRTGSFSISLVDAAQRWSAELVRMLGPQAEGIAPSWQLLLDHVHADDRRAVLAVASAVRHGQAEAEITFRAIRAGLGIADARMRLQLEHDAAGNPLAIAGTVQDVTTQVAAAASLASALATSQRQSARFRALNRAMLLATAKLGDPDLAQILVEELRTAANANLASLHRLPDGDAPLPTKVSLSEKYARWRHFDAPIRGLGMISPDVSGRRILRLTHEQLQAHAAWSDFSGHAAEHPPLRGLLSVPLRDRLGKPVGFLQVSDRIDGEFDDDDEAIAVQFAHIAALTMGWTRLFDELGAAKVQLQARVDDLAASHRLLANAERVARLGSWEIEFGADGARRFSLSDEARRILGATAKGDSAAPTLRDLFNFDDGATFERLHDELVAGTASSFDAEFSITRDDHSQAWIDCRASAIRDATGALVRIVASVQDITDRREQATQERLRNEALKGIAAGVALQTSLDGIAQIFESRHPRGMCSILLLDDEGRLRTAARGRLPPEFSLLVDRVSSGPHVGTCDAALASHSRIFATDIASDRLWLPFARLALRFGLRASWSTPILAASGDVVGSIAIYYRESGAPDAAEIATVDNAVSIAAIAIAAAATRRRAEDREQRFRSLFEYVPEAVFATDVDGIIVDANESAVHMSGYALAELVGRPLASTGVAEERERIDQHVRRAAAGEVQVTESRRQRPDGSRYLTVATKFPIIVHGERVGVFAIVRDVTREHDDRAALKEAIAAQQANNRELEEFAFVASHDLQEPLRKVRAFGDRLRMHLGEAADADTLDYIGRMNAASKRMQRLIDDLLEYSRIGKRDSAALTVDLDDVLRGVVTDLETHIERKQAQVTADPLGAISGDETQMRQLLQNLIANALKFSRAEQAPRIHIASEEFTRAERLDRRRWMRLRVSDNGIGFDNRYKDRIFAPFQRLHGHGEFEGSGIGLAIVRRIVERHGGQVRADGQPGIGAVFTIELPQADRTAAPVRISSTEGVTP